MGGAPAFSGNASGRSKGNMYGEAGRGKGHHAARGRGGQGDGDWKNQKSRLQMAQEEDALEALHELLRTPHDSAYAKLLLLNRD